MCDRRVFVLLANGNAQCQVSTIKVHGKIANALGYTQLPTDEMITIDDDKVSTYMMDINRLNPSLIYVYMDRVQAQMVGDAMAPVLRVISPYTSGAHTPQIHRSFSPIQYVQLEDEHIADIGINIRQSNGELVSFNRGTSYLTLHFKQLR